MQYTGWAIGIIGALSIFVEIIPIKINPWSSLFKYIGRAMNQEIINKVDKLEKDIDNISNKVDANEIKRMRSEILSFSNSCKIGIKHTGDEFKHIIELHGDYEKLINKTNIPNGLVDVEFSYIVEVYKECLQKGTLL